DGPCASCIALDSRRNPEADGIGGFSGILLPDLLPHDAAAGEVSSKLLKRWCPESDLNQRPTAYEAVALPLSYRGVPRLWPAPAYLADCQGSAKALGTFRRA